MENEKLQQITQLLAQADDETLDKVLAILQPKPQEEESFEEIKGKYFNL